MSFSQAKRRTSDPCFNPPIPLAGLLDTGLQPFSSASTYAAINRS